MFKKRRGHVTLECVIYRDGKNKGWYRGNDKIYLPIDGLYPERHLLAFLYNRLSEERRNHLKSMLGGKMKFFLKRFEKGIGDISPFSPVSSYVLVKILEGLSRAGSITLYANIGFSPFYYIVADMFREAVKIETSADIKLVLISGYEIPALPCHSRRQRPIRGGSFDTELLLYFLAGDIWKKFLVSVLEHEKDIANMSDELSTLGFLGKESLTNLKLIDSVVNNTDLEKIDDLVKMMLKSGLAPIYQLYDTASWVYAHFDKKKSVFYRKMAMLAYRNAGEYVVALGRGMEIKGSEHLATTRPLDMEIIKLANIADYYPLEVKEHFKIYQLKRPFNVFHTYMWSVRNLKPVSHIPPIAYALLSNTRGFARLYLYTVILKNRYIEAGRHNIGRDLFLDMRNKILEMIYKNGSIQKDIILHAGITAATSFSEEYPDASIGILRDTIFLARRWNIPTLEAAALNNMATVIMRMDISQAMVRGLYEDAIVVMLSSGGGSMLLPIILNNYTVHMLAGRPLGLIEEFNTFVASLFPHRRIFTDVISVFISLVNEEDVKDRLVNLIQDIKLSSLNNYKRFAEFMFYQMSYVVREKEILKLLSSVGSEPLALLWQASEGKDVSTQVDGLSEIFRYRVFFESFIAQKDTAKAALIGEKLAISHLRYGSMLFHGVTNEWLAHIYEDSMAERSITSYMRALSMYSILGYQNKFHRILDVVGIPIGVWQRHVERFMNPVLEESMRKDITLDLVLSLSTEMGIEELAHGILWRMANFIPFWQGFFSLLSGGNIEFFYGMDISGRRDLPLGEFMSCDTSPGSIQVHEGCMEGVYPISRDQFLTVHIEKVFGDEPFGDIHRFLFKEFVSSVSYIVSSVMIKERGIVDSLTGVYTRWYLYRRMEEILHYRDRTGSHVSVLFIDVDNFKKVNDVYGHKVGDIVLRKVAKAIKNSVRNTDIVGRYGGDEFVVVMPESSIVDAVSVGQRIVKNVKVYLKDTKEAQDVSVSIGVAGTDMCIKCKVDELFALADKAMYEAKRNAKGSVMLFRGERQWN